MQTYVKALMLGIKIWLAYVTNLSLKIIQDDLC